MIERVSKALQEKLAGVCVDLTRGSPINVVQCAVAAIEAMREPTNIMVEFGDAVRGNHADYKGGNGTANVYRAMIHIALAS